MTLSVSTQDLALGDLVEAKKLSPSALDAARARAEREGGAVADWLFALGSVSERELLRAMAQRLGRQYVTLEKVAALNPDPQLLARVPVRLAEHHAVFPFRLDDGGTLWLLCVQPSADPELAQTLGELTGATQLEWVIVLGAAVRAALRRHYYAQADAFENAARELPRGRPATAVPGTQYELGVGETTCPACAEPVQAGAFQCSSCLLLLNDDEVQDLEGSGVGSLVRGLLVSPDDWPENRDEKTPLMRNDVSDPTRPLTTLPAHLVPEIIVPLEAVPSMSPHEASLFVRIDGLKTVAEIAREVGFSPVELGFALGDLKARGYIDAYERAAEESLGEPRLEALEGDSRRVLQLAVSLELAGQWQAAAKALAQGIGRLEHPAPLLNKLAVLLLARNRDYLSAAELLERAVKLDPECEVYRLNLARVRRRR